MSSNNMTLKVSKVVTAKAVDNSKSKNVKGHESSKAINVEGAYCASTPRGFAELHLQRLLKESDAIRSEARAMARLLGADEKTQKALNLRSEFEYLSAEVNSLSDLFKKSSDKAADHGAWEAMQIAVKKRHQAELSSLKTAAKLAGCKGKLGVAESEDDTSYASTPSTQTRLNQLREDEVDAGNVSDQSNTGSSSDNSSNKSNKSKQSTATPDTHASDEDSKSDEKGSDSGVSGASPTLQLRGAVQAPKEAAVPQPRWVPRLDLSPERKSSLDDLDPFHSVLNRRSTTTVASESETSSFGAFSPAPRLLNINEAPTFQSSEVPWTPRLFNGEDEHVCTPPQSDDDLVANPAEDRTPPTPRTPPSTKSLQLAKATTTPRSWEDAISVQETLEEADFAMMHAHRAVAAVQSRHRSGPRTPRKVHPPPDSPPKLTGSASVLQVCKTPCRQPSATALSLTPPMGKCLLPEPPVDLPSSEAPLTARSPARKPLEASARTPPPLTARGARKVESPLKNEIAVQYDHEWKTHTNAVLQRALQTLESYKERTSTPISATPCSPRHPRSSAPMVSPRMNPGMMMSPREAPSQAAYPKPQASPVRGAVVRTPNSQPQAAICMTTKPMVSQSAMNVAHQHHFPAGFSNMRLPSASPVRYR